MAKNVLVERAKERLWGKRAAGLPPEEVRENLRLGAEPEQRAQWPRSGAEFNPVAKRLTEEARSRTAG